MHGTKNADDRGLWGTSTHRKEGTQKEQNGIQVSAIAEATRRSAL